MYSNPSKVHSSYLIPELADELCVIVVSFDDLGFAAGNDGGALDEVRPQGALCQVHFLRLKVHLPNYLIGYL